MSQFGSSLLLLTLAALGASVWRQIRGRRQLRELVDLVGALATSDLPPRSSRQGQGALGCPEVAVLEAVQSLRTALDEARREEGRLRAIVAGMVEGVLVIDQQGIVLMSNQQVEGFLGLPRDEQIGRPLIDLTRHPDLLGLVRQVTGGVSPEAPLTAEIAIDANPSRVLLVTAAAIEQAAGENHVFVLVFHDISELKRLERMRRDFVDNVSHELRTPLAAIGGYTETLLGGAIEDPALAHRFLGIIERHTVRLGRLVTDLLALSDLEFGRMPLRRSEVEAAAVIEAALEMTRQRAEPAGIRLEKSIEAGTPKIAADADRLEQALLNLVDNSIKYTPPGGHITVSARRVAVDDLPTLPAAGGTTVFVELAVTDTGKGVAAADLPRLTERFYRADKARSRELGGTGLGLAIVKHIVQAHGGVLGFESELNRGMTVRLFLPAIDERHDIVGGDKAQPERS